MVQSAVKAAVVTVLAVFGSSVGFTGFRYDEEFPKPQECKGMGHNSMVRVAIALNGVEGLSEADGPEPSILAFDDNRKYMGASVNWKRGSGHIDSGGHADIWINHLLVKSLPPTYLQLGGPNDGICIAYISQRWPDDTLRGWLGDMGKACGKRYYYSNIVVGDTQHRPYCTWLNRDGQSDGSDTELHNEAAGMQIHMPDFTNLTADYNHDPKHYCAKETMLFRKTIDYRPASDYFDTEYLPLNRVHFWVDETESVRPSNEFGRLDDGWPPRRALRPRRSLPPPPPSRRSSTTANKFDGRLITSVHKEHSARDLCNDPLSHGPDFVSHSESVYCDMQEHRYWPLCVLHTFDNHCYDLASLSLLRGKGKIKRSHVQVEHWT